MIAARAELLNPVVCPTPAEVFHATVYIMRTPPEYQSILATAGRVGRGVFVSSLIGLPLGILLSFYRALFKYVDWAVELLRAIPPAVVLPIFFFASPQSGVDSEYRRIGLVVFGCLPILLMQITETARRIPNQRIEFAKLIGASSVFILRKVLVFEVLPNFFIAFRTILSFGIVIVIVTEMIYPPALGVGARIVEWQRDYGIDYVYAYALISGLLGILANQTAVALERRVIYWKT